MLSVIIGSLCKSTRKMETKFAIVTKKSMVTHCVIMNEEYIYARLQQVTTSGFNSMLQGRSYRMKGCTPTMWSSYCCTAGARAAMVKSSVQFVTFTELGSPEGRGGNSLQSTLRAFTVLW